MCSLGCSFNCCKNNPEEEDDLLRTGASGRGSVEARRLDTHSGLATPDDSLLHVSARGISAAEIRVEWSQYLDEYHTHPYKIRYRPKDKKKKLKGLVNDYKSERVTGGNTFVLKNLKPDIQYEIGVVDKSLAQDEQEYSTCYAWTLSTRVPIKRPVV